MTPGRVFMHAGVAGAIFLASFAHAQQTSRPASDETPIRPIPPFERGSGKPVEPTPDGAVGAEVFGSGALTLMPDELSAKAGVLAPEGSYYPRVNARVIKTANAELVLDPDDKQESGAAAPPAMVILPSMRRDQLGAALDSAGTDRFTLGGQVFTYRGRGYLLLATFAPIIDEPSPRSAATDTSSGPASAQRQTRDEDVEGLIQELEAAGGQQRTLTPGGAKSRAAAIDQSTLASLTEGSLLTNRRGRVVRKADLGGRLTVAFDNDPDSPAPAPLLLLPCQTLEQLEGLVASRGEDVSVHITGRVLTSSGRPALLPVFFQVTRRTGLNPGQ